MVPVSQTVFLSISSRINSTSFPFYQQLTLNLSPGNTYERKLALEVLILVESLPANSLTIILLAIP